MPYTVYLSQVKDAEAYDAAVKEYIKLMIAHQLDKTGKPRPTAHPFIEFSVKRVMQGSKRPDTFIPDYVIEDDTQHDEVPQTPSNEPPPQE